MSKTKRDWIDYFNAIIKHAELFCILTRDSAFQENAVVSLESLKPDFAGLKEQAIERRDEGFANLLLGFECVAGSLANELKMWIALKDERPDQAWDDLISAQEFAMAAARAHPGFEHLSHQMERLEKIEQLLFPPQVFVSAGLVVQVQECSVCGEEYGECDHLAGMPYWGKFCAIITRGLEFNHVAMVKEPADKRCRILGIPTKDGNRNRMSWKIEPLKQASEESESDPDGAVTVPAAIIRAGN